MIRNELYHYGIPRRSGRYPWGSGKKPYQTLKKGTTFSRLSLSKNEDVKGVRKYVSIGTNPEKVWVDLFKKGYSETRDIMYSNTYKSSKNIKVSDVETNKKFFDDWFSDHSTALIYNLPIIVHEWEKQTGATRTGNAREDFFRQIGMNNVVNKSYFDYMKSKGFDAIVDNFGNESGGKNSIIILDPDNTLHLITQKEIALKD